MLTRLRQAFLCIGLTATYVLLITPLRWCFGWRRCRGAPSVGGSYWRPCAIDTRSRATFEAMGAGETSFIGRWRWLLRRYPAQATAPGGGVKWALLCWLAPWAWLASAKEETELRPDLYVLF